MEIRKLTFNGTSTLVALPPAFLAAAKIKAGDHVVIEMKKNFTINIRKLPSQAAGLSAAIRKGESL